MKTLIIIMAATIAAIYLLYRLGQANQKRKEAEHQIIKRYQYPPK